MIRTYKESVEYWKQAPIDTSGYTSDDIGWSDQYILQNILNLRSSELKSQASNKGIHNQNYQTLSCVELEEVKQVDLDLPSNDCYVLRSIEPLPRTIDIQSVVSIDGNINFTYVEWSKIKFKKLSRSSAIRNSLFYSIKDEGDGEYLYVYNHNFLKSISLTAAFEDPYSAITFPICGKVDNTKLCNPWTSDIKIDRDSFDRIITSSWSKLLQVRSFASPDRRNDDSDQISDQVNSKPQ